MGYFDYEKTLLGYFQNLRMELLSKPLNLGGISASGGGTGGPVGGFTGYLPQTRVSYDLSEAATLDVPISGASLLDNLNHIRYRINQINASGISGITVLDNGVQEGTNITAVNFSGGSVTVVGNQANVSFSGGSSVTTLDSLSDVVITSPLTYAFLQYDGANWIDLSTARAPEGIVIGGGYPTNYMSLTNTGAMTLVGTSARYEKLSYPMTAGQGGASPPTWIPISGTAYYGYQFAVNNDMQFVIDMPHNWQKSNVTAYVDWETMGYDGGGTTRYVKWEVTYAIADAYDPGFLVTYGEWDSGVISTETSVYEPAERTRVRTEIGTIPTADYGQSTSLHLCLKRIVASGTAPAVDPVGVTFGIHYVVSKLGTAAVNTY